jgi:hypothetical protein
MHNTDENTQRSHAAASGVSRLKGKTKALAYRLPWISTCASCNFLLNKHEPKANSPSNVQWKFEISNIIETLEFIRRWDMSVIGRTDGHTHTHTHTQNLCIICQLDAICAGTHKHDCISDSVPVQSIRLSISKALFRSRTLNLFRTWTELPLQL